jgi:hypothetical protein
LHSLSSLLIFVFYTSYNVNIRVRALLIFRYPKISVTIHLLLLMYNYINYIQTSKVYGKCTEHEMCVLMSSTVLVQNSLRCGKCSPYTAQKTTEVHIDLRVEWWLIVSGLNGKEVGWTFSEHLTNVNFLDIRSALLIWHMPISRDVCLPR